VVEVVDIDLDVVVLSLVSHCVRARARAPVEQALLVAVMRVAYAVPRARAPGQNPGAREVDCSWQMAAFKLPKSSYDNNRLFESLRNYLAAGLL
jgi:hypothetical protein